MAYAQIEVSNTLGRPVRLYSFTRGSLSWNYAAADQTISVAGAAMPVVYTGCAISDSGITQSGEAGQDAVTISAPAGLAVTTLFRGTPPADSLFITMREIHFGDNEALVMWVGTVASITQKDDASFDIICNTLTASFARNGLRLAYSRTCPYALYDKNCAVDRTKFSTAITISALDGDSLTAPELATRAAGWFTNGFVEWSIGDATYERRGIMTHTASTVTLIGSTDQLAVGASLTAYAGCSRQSFVCDNKFSNIPNYGGFTMMPGRSPFDGNPVF